MIKVPTVLVLGAGASVPFGFPSGQTLVDIISYYFHLEKDIPEFHGKIPQLDMAMRRMNQMLKDKYGKEKINSFIEHLYGEESIDVFLEHQMGDFLKIGKAAIAAALLPFERESSLDFYFMYKRLEGFFDEEKRERNVTENNWYQLLWGALNAPFEEFQNNDLRIITFNYDRSLEHYLYTRLKNRYPNKSDKAYASKICPIVHIHGSLGPLPWQLDSDESKHKAVPYEAMMKQPYGPETGIELKTLKEIWFDIARNSIRVIHEESQGDTTELKTAHEWIRSNQRIYFLGFGYHPTNIERLRIESNCDITKDVRGTAYGLSLARRRYIVDRLAKINVLRIEKDNLSDKDTDVYTFLHDCVSLE